MKYFVLLAVLILNSMSVFADDTGNGLDHPDAEISVLIEGEGKYMVESAPPAFKEFSVVQSRKHNQPAILDLSSHQSAEMFRTTLMQGVTKGPNFAGHYALVSWGCGNECQGTLVVELKTGQVYSVRGGLRPLQSSRGLDFRLGSRLLIVDPPCSDHYNPCVSHGSSELPVRYYLMENEGLRLIHKIPCRLRNERQVCG